MVTDNTQTEVNEHMKDATYVTLPATQAGLRVLQKTNILAIIGRSGSGKTKCALDILSKLHVDGLRIMKLTSIQLWNESVNASVPCCVWFDDLLENKSDNFIDQHRAMFQTIKACAQNGNVKVVLTIRSDIYDTHKACLFRFLREESLMDLESEKHQLTRELKNEILKHHMKVRKRDISELTMDDILQSKPLLGFPLCCDLYSSIESNFQKGAAFFTCPGRELIEAFNMLRVSSKETYFAISYAALQNRAISLDDINVDLVDELSQILDAGNISFEKAIHQVVKDKAYFQRQVHRVYAIKHISIYKAILVSLSELSDSIKPTLIKSLQPNIIKEILLPEDTSEEELGCNIVVPKSLYHMVSSEFTKKVEQGYTSLVSCELLNNTSFIGEIVQSLGDRWSTFCLQNLRYGCKYGQLNLIKEMLPQIYNTSKDQEAIFVGLKEACIEGQNAIVHLIFENQASSVVSTDEIIQLTNCAWKNYELCSYLIMQLSNRQINDTQCKALLSNLARDNENCLKLIQEATHKFNISSKEIVSNTANIAGRRGSLLVLKWLLKNHVELGDDILHNAMLGVCKRGEGAVSKWLVEAHEHVIKEHLLEYLEHAETPDMVQRLLRYESQLSKLELGELLNKHCAIGHCLIVKVIVDNCDRYSSLDIQNALEIASRHGKLDVFTIIGDSFSISHEERTKIMNEIQNVRGGIRTPMSLNPYTPANYSNIPSVNISTPNVYAMKNPETTTTRAWKKSINETAGKEYKRALQLNKLCGSVENPNSDETIRECRALLSSSPKIPDFLLVECALYACKQQNYKILQIICENNETLPFKLLVNAGKDQLDIEAIRSIQLIMRDIGNYSLSLIVRNTKHGKDLETFINAFDADVQFDLKDYLNSLNYLVINHIQYAKLLLDASVKLAECDDVLVPACRLDFPEIVKFILETGNRTDSTLDGAIQVTIKYDKAHVLEILIKNKADDDMKKIFVSCCNQSAKACIDMFLKKESNMSYLQFEKSDNEDSTLDAAIQTTLENDNADVLELFIQNKSDEHTKEIFLRCCEQSAKACIEILLKKEFRAYLQHNIGNILKHLCAKNFVKIIETIITTITCIKLDKKDTKFVLLEACSKNWQCVVQKMKDIHKFTARDIVPLVKSAFDNNNRHLVHCLLAGIKFSPTQRSTMVKHALKYDLYEDAATIIQQADLDWFMLRDLSIPTQLTDSFKNFMHQVIASHDVTKSIRPDYNKHEGKYTYIKRVSDKFPDIGISTQAVGMFHDICKCADASFECIDYLRHLLNNYRQLFDKELIMTGFKYAIARKEAGIFTALTEFYVKEYKAEDIKSYALMMFVNKCNTWHMDTEVNECLEMIIKLFHLPDDKVMAGVNDYIQKRYKNSAPEPWTCGWRPTLHTLLVVLNGEPSSIVRLICSKWEIDDQTIDGIVSGRCNESDVWKILLEKFPTEITNEMIFKILLCCVMVTGMYKNENKVRISNIVRTVLSTDKQRSNEEVFTLLSACLNEHYVTPLLQKYQNLPLQDVLRVMNHLLTYENRPNGESAVYKIIEVYSEYHDVFRAMINEMQSKPGFDKQNFYWVSNRSVLAEVVKKFKDIYAHNTSSSQDTMLTESAMA